MSRAKELLLECKIKLGIKSDYALAKALKSSTGMVSHYMAGKRSPDPFTCLQMALILKRDPLEIIAEVEAESEKNEKKREFWRDFLVQARKVTGRGLLAVLACMLFWWPVPKAQAADAAHNGGKRKTADRRTLERRMFHA